MRLRRATETDLPEIARSFRESRDHALPYLPKLHSAEEDLQYFSIEVVPKNQVYVAMDDAENRILGFIAFNNEWVNHLYLRPEACGAGYGSKLLEQAKQGSSKLKLWVFQRNQRARDFYARHGFLLVQETDGTGNEEREPDALLEWRASSIY